MSLLLLGVFVGVLVNDFCLIRSYRACLREEVGVWGTVSAFEPLWWTGVDGKESPESVLEGETEGVLGVKSPVKSSSKARREGVFGNGTELVAICLAFSADTLFGEGVCSRGVPSLGRVKDPFSGDFDDEALKAFAGEVGEGGVDKIFIEDGALGEADARSCVSFEGLLGTTNCGRSAMGMFGIWVASACSYNR